MSARVLVVDDVPANVKLLEARLTAEYFEVVTAADGFEALEICDRDAIDIVLLDVMMPGMDGFEVCRRLKSDPGTSHIPIVMVTALDRASDRVAGLEAGADDFLTKPVKDLQLLSRVRSLVRLKSLTDELRLRAATTRSIGIQEMLGRRLPEIEELPRVLLIDENPASAERIATMLNAVCEIDTASGANEGVFLAMDRAPDCVLICTRASEFDPLRLCSQLQSFDRTRYVPIILIADEGEEARVMRAFELGVNDYVTRPIDRQELTARIRTQIRRKLYNDQLRMSVAETIEMAVIDGLTGLHNRRYLDSHIETLFQRAVTRRRPLSIMITDLDRFKDINDTYGHDGGDQVLKEFARRIRANVRGIDLVCRFGGEEFVVIMPDTEPLLAQRVAERVRHDIEKESFQVAGKAVPVTVSIGVASIDYGADSVSALMRRADSALYEAKNSGRNRVVAPAA
ncbi:MAG: PleD family two-component system response regulator [Mesorhizobium sp.]